MYFCWRGLIFCRRWDEKISMKNSPYGRESAFLSEILAVRAVLLLSGIHWNIQMMRFCILRFLRSGQQTVLTHQLIQKGGKLGILQHPHRHHVTGKKEEAFHQTQDGQYQSSGAVTGKTAVLPGKDG